MRKVFLLSVILCVCILSKGQSKSANSSSYQTALGVKFYPGGITLKHFFNGIAAFESRAFMKFMVTFQVHPGLNGI